MRIAAALASWIVLALTGCFASSHSPSPSALGLPASSGAMLASLATPGPIGFEKIVAADWAVDRSGMINLDHPKAQAAGIVDGSEPIHLYLYVLRHPEFGTYLVDSGVEAGFRSPESSEHVGVLVRSAMKTEALEPRVTTGEWLARSGGPVDGVFLTHIHLDHIMGLPDLPADTPVWLGPGETTAEAFLNLFSRSTTDALLGASPALHSWRFEQDPDGRFEGVVDVFGDGSLWALHVPGHSPGSTAFVVRTPQGPQLLVGDASHTKWGWENGVEPGSFSLDRPRSAKNLARLRELAEDVPQMKVHLGHQSLDD